MSLISHTNTFHWLKQLNGKSIEKIYQVDFNQDRHEDIYLPWLFFITFHSFDLFIELEGDFDGSHIKARLHEMSALEKKLQENHMPDEPDLWQVYPTTSEETLGKILNAHIYGIEYGVDKDEYEINGTISKGDKNLLTYIRFICDKAIITIFEGGATGLGVSDDPYVKLEFEDTFDSYLTV